MTHPPVVGQLHALLVDRRQLRTPQSMQIYAGICRLNGYSCVRCQRCQCLFLLLISFVTNWRFRRFTVILILLGCLIPNLWCTMLPSMALDCIFALTIFDHFWRMIMGQWDKNAGCLWCVSHLLSDFCSHGQDTRSNRLRWFKDCALHPLPIRFKAARLDALQSDIPIYWVNLSNILVLGCTSWFALHRPFRSQGSLSQPPECKRGVSSSHWLRPRRWEMARAA